MNLVRTILILTLTTSSLFASLASAEQHSGTCNTNAGEVEINVNIATNQTNDTLTIYDSYTKTTKAYFRTQANKSLSPSPSFREKAVEYAVPIFWSAYAGGLSGLLAKEIFGAKLFTQVIASGAGAAAGYAIGAQDVNVDKACSFLLQDETLRATGFELVAP